MIKGLFTSVSGLQAAEVRQQVLASNLANANTPGFKTDDVTNESFEKVLGDLFDTQQLGTGTLSAGYRIDVGQGSLTQTGGPLDVALDGPGFFVLNGPSGPLYTRAGRFTRGADGTIHSPEGTAVQGADGNPIVAIGVDVRVQPDGTVLSDGTTAGRIRVVSLDPTTLTRAGTSTFTSAVTPVDTPARVVSGALEASNADVTSLMTTMTLVLRAFEAGRQAMQLQNDTLGQTVNQVGQLR